MSVFFKSWKSKLCYKWKVQHHLSAEFQSRSCPLREPSGTRPQAPGAVHLWNRSLGPAVSLCRITTESGWGSSLLAKTVQATCRDFEVFQPVFCSLSVAFSAVWLRLSCCPSQLFSPELLALSWLSRSPCVDPFEVAANEKNTTALRLKVKLNNI